jgi:hypothetical protein
LGWELVGYLGSLLIRNEDVGCDFRKDEDCFSAKVLDIVNDSHENLSNDLSINIINIKFFNITSNLVL